MSRHRAAVTLGRIGPKAKDAVPSLITALKDMEHAFRFLERADEQRYYTPDRIKKRLEEQDPDDVVFFVLVRDAAAEALGEIGAGAAEAIPALKRMADCWRCGDTALRAIRKIEEAVRTPV